MAATDRARNGGVARHEDGTTAAPKGWRASERYEQQVLVRALGAPRARKRCVAPPDGQKSERNCRDLKVDENRAHEHPTATGPTTVHATTITRTLELPSPSPWGSGATQTSTSACACCTYAERSRSGDAFSRRTSRRITKQIAATWISDRTTQPGSLQTKPPTNCVLFQKIFFYFSNIQSRPTVKTSMELFGIS